MKKTVFHLALLLGAAFLVFLRTVSADALLCGTSASKSKAVFGNYVVAEGFYDEDEAWEHAATVTPEQIGELLAEITWGNASCAACPYPGACEKGVWNDWDVGSETWVGPGAGGTWTVFVEVMGTVQTMMQCSACDLPWY